MDSLSVVAIILAAGQSRRMGPVNKLLMEIEGVPMVERVLLAIREGGVDDIYVVTGFERERIESCLGDESLNFVFNESYEEGMGSSLAKGAQAIESEAAAGILVCLGDLPYLGGGTVRELLDEFKKRGGERIVLPSYMGQSGHPIIFPIAYRESLGSLNGDVGAKALIRRERKNVVELEVGDESVIRDLDTNNA